MSAHDERLRKIARDAVPSRVYSGNVKALRAVWEAARSEPVTDAEVEAAARALNVEGWTCNGGEDEPGNYDSCPDCKRVCDPLARVALEAARTTRQEATDAE